MSNVTISGAERAQQILPTGRGLGPEQWDTNGDPWLL
jgi:hypothetical protein